MYCYIIHLRYRDWANSEANNECQNDEDKSLSRTLTKSMLSWSNSSKNLVQKIVNDQIWDLNCFSSISPNRKNREEKNIYSQSRKHHPKKEIYPNSNNNHI